MYISSTLLALAVAMVVIRSAYLLTRKSSSSSFAQSHGCQPCPRLKNHRPWGTDRLEQIFRANSGNTLEHRFLGSLAFGTIDPLNIKTILSTNFEGWSLGLRRNALFPLFGDGIFTQDGEDWQRSRRTLEPRFSARKYEDLEIFHEPTNNLLSSLPNEGVVDLQPRFFHLTLDVTMRYLLGGSLPQKEYGVFAKSFDRALDFVAKRTRLQGVHWLIDSPQFRRDCRVARDFADKIIMERMDMTGQEPSDDFLHSLAAHWTNPAELRDQIMNVLIAGRDTTACLMTWTMFHLVRHPSVMSKLRHEISCDLKGITQFTRAQMYDLPYLRCVLNEVLRLHPSVPVNSRTALRDTFLPRGGGQDGRSPVFVPKGAVVGYCVYAMHRRPDLYGMDAREFRPERWLEPMPRDQDSATKEWSYLPFNAGRRRCPGSDFAFIEAGFVIIRLLQYFPEIRRPAKEDVSVVGEEKQTITLVLSSTSGCKVEIA